MIYILLIIGMLFFINPVVNLFDFLPDFIGYVLFVISIRKASKVDGYFEKSKKLFLLLSLVTFAKSFTIFFIPYNDSSFKLLMMVVYGLIELFIYLPAFSNFYEGFSYITLKQENESNRFFKTKDIRISKSRASSLAKKNKYYIFEEIENNKSKYYLRKNIDYIQSVKNVTIAFFILKTILSVAPELYSLQLYEYTDALSGSGINLSQYYNLFIIAAWLVTIIFAIPVYVKNIKFFNKFKKFDLFNSFVKTKYKEDYLNNDCKMIVSRFKVIFVLMTCAFVLLIKLYNQHVTITPNIITAILIAILSCLLFKYSKKIKLPFVFSLIWLVVDIIREVLESNYFSIYNLNTQIFNSEASSLYSKIVIFYGLSSIIGTVVITLFILNLNKIVCSHISLRKNIDNTSYYSNNETFLETKKDISTKFIFVLVSSVVSVIIPMFNAILALDVDFIFGICICTQIVCLIVTIYALSYIYDNVYKKIEFYL